jgi:hypothetical protein
VDGQVGALGKALAEQSVRVLVRAALPWRVGVAEVDRDSGGGGQGQVAGHLASLVPGDAACELRGEGGDGVSHGLLDGERAVIVRQVEEEQVAGHALDEGPDGACVVPADDEVPFPVAGNRAVVGLGGTLADHHHVRHGTGPLRGALGLSPGASRSQASGEFPAQFSPALHVEALVDRLVAHAHPGVVGVVKGQCGFQRTSQLGLTNGRTVVGRRPLRGSPSSGTCGDGC